MKNQTDRPFRIVGIGASAGGLEALEIFLKNVPTKSGMAFVVVQHLDPTHKGIMVELLQRSTPMPVAQAKDRMRVEPDCVYVIPPNRDLSILHGVLHLLEPTAPRGLRLPIDYFFRALADDRQDLSIGVILSGMGSDGTLGLRAIKEKAGVVFVQSPASAKFDGMPRSAIDAGMADVIAPAEELPGRIVAYLKHAPQIAQTDLPLEGKAQSALEKIFILLRTRTGHDFSLYKKSTVYRRIERRMGLHQIGRIVDYVRVMQENPQETELLFKELLIGVTSFFRDPAAWELLKEKFIPALLTARQTGGTIRAWTPGCSTGEEAYSLAIVFREVLEKVKTAGIFSLQVFATDLDKDAIEDLTVHHSYRNTVPLDKALEEVSSRSGSKYNPDVVAACLRLFWEKGYSLDRPEASL
jgi:two-component system CheB/CheR fusion protein